MEKINHYRIFFRALRSALLFAAGFIIYEILSIVEKSWNDDIPSHKIIHFYQIKGLKFILILLVDLLILYGIVIISGIDI